MAEYIERKRILDYADEIEPMDGDYFDVSPAEKAALDKQEEIAEELRKLPYVGIDLGKIMTGTIEASYKIFCSTMNAVSKECSCCPYVWCENGTCFNKFKEDVIDEWCGK